MKNFDLIWAREYAGITQTKIAEIFGVSRRTVINWEQGHTKLPSAKFKYLLGVLDIDPKLVPQNKQPEPTTPTPVVPVVAPPPAPAATQPKPHKRAWKDRPLKDFAKDVLNMSVALSDKQESFDVPDVMASWLRVWGKDTTPIDDAWQFVYSMLRSFELFEDLLVRVNPEEKDITRFRWTLHPKGWETFEKRYMDAYCDEEEPTAREKYPNAFNRLFGDLV